MKSMLKGRAFVVGVGMSKFQKPGKFSYIQLAHQAGQRALLDSGIPYEHLNAGICSYISGESCCGQRVLYHLGLTGIPIVNVNNNCSSGATALFMAQSQIKAGIYDSVLVLGFEQMQMGSILSKFSDRVYPLDLYYDVNEEFRGPQKKRIPPTIFASAGLEHMERYGTTREHFGKVAYKNHKHSVHNPYSQQREEYSMEQIMGSQMIADPLTLLQCCPTTDGAAAAVLCSEDFMKKWGLEDQAVEILSMNLVSDLQSNFAERSSIKLVGYDNAKVSMQKHYESVGLTGKDAQVVELHDCFSANELVTYEALGLCEEGEAGDAIDRNDFTYGGKVVVNPTGGLISKGHPIGATGVAQCAELNWQLRGMAMKRQVQNATIALQHNLGLIGGAVTGFYKKYNEKPQKSFSKYQSSCPKYLESIEEQEGLIPASFDRFINS